MVGVNIKIPWDIVGHFEWRHPIPKGDTGSLKLDIKHVYLSSHIVPADGLPPLGARASADTAMAKFGSRIYTTLNSLRQSTKRIYASCIIGSDNGLLPGRRHTIIWTNAGILLIWPLGTNFKHHGAHLGPTGPRCAPCWPYELAMLYGALLQWCRHMFFLDQHWFR